MALLHCRDCGAEINSDTRQTQCQECGALFPFACSVCGKSLRPPFPVYSDERYISASNEPLCTSHFERQCPECNKWFQADQNPGYFLCLACAHVRTGGVSSDTSQPYMDTGATPSEESVTDETSPPTPQHRVVDAIAGVGLVALIIALLTLTWQSLPLLRALINR